MNAYRTPPRGELPSETTRQSLARLVVHTAGAIVIGVAMVLLTAWDAARRSLLG